MISFQSVRKWLRTAVSNLVGTRDQFHGRQVFLGLRAGKSIVSGWFKCIYIYCALYFYYYYISSTSVHQAFDSGVWGPQGDGAPVLAWKIPWTEEPGRLQSMGSQRVGHDWETSLSLCTFMHWRRKWQPTPVFLPGESQRRESLVGCRLWGHTVSDTTEVT